MANSLYVISTPIGNHEDISLRALKTLYSCEILLCEDTRKTKALMLKYQQHEYLSILLNRFALPRFESFHEFNENYKLPEIIAKLKQGKEIGLVSNAGTPTISDPGYKLVRECVDCNIPVICIPGANAAVAALSISGLPTDKFLFLGFLPKKQGKKEKLFEQTVNCSLASTFIFYESPYRIKKTLDLMKNLFGNVKVVIARELTKIHENVENKTIDEWLIDLEKKQLKGEIVVLFGKPS